MPTSVTNPPAALPTIEIATGARVARTYFPELESLRGIAILIVVVFHLDAAIRAQLGADALPAIGFVRAGHAGVDLFFVLSGFLLSLPFLVEASGGRYVDRRRYLMRRAVRILPLYYTVVLLAAVSTARTPGDVLRAAPHLAFLNTTLPPNLYPFGGVWWSLSTEVQFYLVLPLVPAVLSSRRGRLIGLMLLALYATTYAVHLAHSSPARLGLNRSLFGRGPLFVCGIAAAAIYLRARGAPRWTRHGAADVVLVAIVVALEALLRRVTAWGRVGWEVWPAWHLVEGPLWAGFLLTLVLAPLLTKRLFCNAALTHLGLVSYSLYLIHPPLIFYGSSAVRALRPGLLESRTMALGVEAILFIVCVALASVTYALVERPLLIHKDRLR